jgi:hypothetical protein
VSIGHVVGSKEAVDAVMADALRADAIVTDPARGAGKKAACGSVQPANDWIAGGTVKAFARDGQRQ